MAADFLLAAQTQASAPGNVGGMAQATETGCAVSISVDAYHALCRLRRPGEPDGSVVERALAWLDSYSVVAKAIGSEDLRKAGVVVRKMRAAGYSDEVVTTMCRALFGPQEERDLQKAFKSFDRDRSGFIDADEFKRALPLMGENISEVRVQELFQLVDVDRSGLLDFEEFCMLVRGMNPKRGSSSADVFETFRSTAEDSLGIVGEAVGSVATGTSAAISAMSTAWAADIRGLGPFQLRKAGVVLRNMREAGYSDEMACSICRALFCDQSDKQLRKAFRFFDKDRSGLLDATEFRQALPLMGEDVPESRVGELFAGVDVDGTGQINFHEFCVLVRALASTDKADGSGASSDTVSEAFAAVAETWGSITAKFR